MIDFKNMKRSENKTYVLVPRWCVDDLRFALNLAGEKDWKIIRTHKSFTDEIKEWASKLTLPEDEDIRMYSVLVSHFEPGEIEPVLENIADDEDIQNAMEEEEFNRLEKEWDEHQQMKEDELWDLQVYYHCDYEGDDAESRLEAEKKALAEKYDNIMYKGSVASDFFQRDMAEEECKALLSENIERILEWVEDEEAKDTISFRRSMDEESVPYNTVQHGDTMFCEYHDMDSVIRLKKDKDSDIGFLVDDVYIDNIEYMKKFNVNDEAAPKINRRKPTPEERLVINEKIKELGKAIADGSLIEKIWK